MKIIIIIIIIIIIKRKKRSNRVNTTNSMAYGTWKTIYAFAMVLQ